MCWWISSPTTTECCIHPAIPQWSTLHPSIMFYIEERESFFEFKNEWNSIHFFLSGFVTIFHRTRFTFLQMAASANDVNQKSSIIAPNSVALSISQFMDWTMSISFWFLTNEFSGLNATNLLLAKWLMIFTLNSWSAPWIRWPCLHLLRRRLVIISNFSSFFFFFCFLFCFVLFCLVWFCICFVDSIILRREPIIGTKVKTKVSCIPP